MREISLIGKYGTGKVAIVDDEYFDELSKYKWYISCCGYVVRSKTGGGVIRMHRQIMNPPKELVIDHINQNKLDNRKVNLRVCTVAENNMNSPKYARNRYMYKGVTHLDESGRWRGFIKHGDSTEYLGTFKDEVEAAKAYDYYAFKYFGEFASLNFPNEIPQKPKREVVRCRNTSGYRGVSWSKSAKKWVSIIRYMKKQYYLGLFDNKDDAARMYNFWAIDLLGDFNLLNTIKTEAL